MHDKSRNRLIIQDKAKDSFYLKLGGDFDGSFAHELFNTLLEHGAGYYQIFIDTNELKTIHPFDIDIFQKNRVGSTRDSETLSLLGELDIKFREIRSRCADQVGGFSATLPITILYS